MNASSWLNLRLTGVFTSDSLIFHPTLGNSRKEMTNLTGCLHFARNNFKTVEHLDFKRTPRNISEYMYIFDSQ